METDAYTLMASHEDRHWWFVGRRAVIDGLLDRLELPPDARVLEAGCGTGGNLYHLAQRGQLSAFEPHPVAIDIARGRHPDVDLDVGELPHDLPFAAGSFDLVAALDVLEHVDDDAAALNALVLLARPGGYVLLTVPTHPFLFGSHDRRLHHVRRYTVPGLLEICRQTSAELVHEGAFNTILAPVAFAARLGEKLLAIDLGNQERLPAAPLNAVLAKLFAVEGRLVRTWRLPFGLSHAVILRRAQ